MLVAATIAIGAVWLGAVGKETIQPAIIEQRHLADMKRYEGLPLAPVMLYPAEDQALVSLVHDEPASYAACRAPWGEGDGPVYPLVWRAVAQLGLGTAESPLGDFIRPGDKVVIKPNVEGPGRYQYTHESAVRPLIDMAAKAGASEIVIADSSPSDATRVMGRTGYRAMVDAINAAGGGPAVRLVDIDRAKWSWVNPGAASAYPRGRFRDEDLLSHKVESGAPAGKGYHWRPDSQGRHPAGEILNWYALSDIIMELCTKHGRMTRPLPRTRSYRIGTGNARSRARATRSCAGPGC